MTDDNTDVCFTIRNSTIWQLRDLISEIAAPTIHYTGDDQIDRNQAQEARESAIRKVRSILNQYDHPREDAQ